MTRHEDLTARIEALQTVRKTMIPGSVIFRITGQSIADLLIRRGKLTIGQRQEIVEPFACLTLGVGVQGDRVEGEFAFHGGQ